MRAQTYLKSILFIVATITLMANATAEDELSSKVEPRFTQAANRTFKAFNPEQEQTWQRPFFFMQLADTQYGMFSGNKGFDQEVALVEQAVKHINRLRPRFVIVCGDLTNATPNHARYQAQVSQFQQDFSNVDPEIPLVCVCGNHDIGNRPTRESIASYQQNFGDDYFSFWVGGVCNVVLNSSVLKDPSGAPEVLAAQQTWLDAQLQNAKAAKAKHILLFQHHPLFLSQEDEPDEYFNIPLVRRTPLLEQLKQADVRAMFAGHYHRNAYGRAGAMEMITTGPVGRPLGKDPSGFRIVIVDETKIQHQYWAMDNVPEKIELPESSVAP
ncbi:Calcineurin-like phosphoesterase superfamily domain protein [Novipirellula galeiformis]|uniref:Serine/threonine-protein phosphatase CPPED1 n=1 Tax=Novipirellula galeiformis TaxID=2528004 RepID=A0A5C6CAB1_9BACT|nr:metallophosphoesterase [Novipirellula galeiformis]TWU20316.1 Calcineurin-like phosphoesterase superfamily domain protein [Novipirellula galeiformis]